MTVFRMIASTLLFASLVLTQGCAVSSESEPTLWSELQAMCGNSYEGRMVEGTEPSDQDLADEVMTMYIRDCTETTIRIPFHVGEDRSRTWVLEKVEGGISLEHVHRHRDGTEDEISRYGGDSVGAAGLAMDFPADQRTAEMIPAAAPNVWTLRVDPARSFTYELERPGRRFRAEFDLTRKVATPPAAW